MALSKKLIPAWIKLGFTQQQLSIRYIFNTAIRRIPVYYPYAYGTSVNWHKCRLAAPLLARALSIGSYVSSGFTACNPICQQRHPRPLLDICYRNRRHDQTGFHLPPFWWTARGHPLWSPFRTVSCHDSMAPFSAHSVTLTSWKYPLRHRLVCGTQPVDHSRGCNPGVANRSGVGGKR